MDKEIILITGASSETGCAIMRKIGRKGDVLLAHYNNSLKNIEDVKTQVEAEIVPVKADLRNKNDIHRLIEFIAGKGLFPDKIVHLAAPRLKINRFKDVGWDDFQTNIEIQLKAGVVLLQEFLPGMVKKRKGKIVFVLSSVTAGLPPKAMSDYVTAKYALLGLMRALASEYAGKMINVNAVSPSMMETAFLSNIPDKIIEISAEQNPFKRNATPQDTAAAVSFLLSSDADFITGVNIPVTGGSSL